MRKRVSLVVLASLLFSGFSSAEVDLSNSFNGSMEWGYKGLELSGRYTNFSLNTDKNKMLIDSKRSEIENTIINNAKYFLTTDNTDRDKVFSLNYIGFNSGKLKSNTSSLIFGISSDINSRLGLSLNYGMGKVSDVKVKDISGSLFYNSKLDTSEYTILGYIGKSKSNSSKINQMYYGGYGEYKHDIPSHWLGSFEYFTPFVYGDVNFQGLTEKNIKENSINSQFFNTTIGIAGKNEVEIDDIKISTTIKAGYNRELLKDKKYNVLEIKENNVDKIVTEIKVNVKYNETIDIYGGYRFNKSLNTSNNDGIAELGFKFKF